MDLPLRAQLQASLGTAFILERELGGSGMSRVYLAEETAFKRNVVVKLLAPELAAGVDVDRFKREIQLAAKLQHPHIVPVITAGESAGLPYYTMPFVEGESLRERLTREGQLPIGEAIAILRDVAKALGYAHERGIVHRDIKPGNVLLAGDSATVTDFGIAKALVAAGRGRSPGNAETDSDLPANLTRTGISIGTLGYMSPEQAAGDPAVDHRADLYALGCIAYELLVGQPPFVGRTPQRTLAAHLTETPRDVTELRADIPPTLARLVMRLLAKEPDERPQSASEVARELDAAASGASHNVTPEVARRGEGTFAWALIAYAVAFLVVAIVARAAIVVIGLPDWVFPGAVIVMALGLPVILFTAYAQSVARGIAVAAVASTPTGSPMPAPATGMLARIAVKASPHLSWRLTMLGGAYAVGAFILLVGGFMGLRALGIGPLGSLKLGDARVLIAQFTESATDGKMGDVVAEAVRGDLSGSTLTIVSPEAVAATLREMQLPAQTKLDVLVARDVARRAGIPVIVTGDIHGLGGGWVVNVRLVSPDSGQVLATDTKTADGLKDLIPTIGNIMRQLRDKAGEPLKHLQSTPKLAEAMTPSFDALRKYSEAVAARDQGNMIGALELYEEAFAIDTMFASAYSGAAVALGNVAVDRDRQLRYAKRAFELSDRLPEAERYFTRARFYGSFDPPKQSKELDAFLRIRPLDAIALNFLAVGEMRLRDFSSAERHLRMAIAADSLGTFAPRNLVGALAGQGKVAEADSMIRVWWAKFPEHPFFLQTVGLLLFSRRQIDSMNALLERRLHLVRDQGAIARLSDLLRDGYLAQGRLREARRMLDNVAAAKRLAGDPPADLNIAPAASLIIGWHLGDAPRALRVLDSALAASPLDRLAFENRPYGSLAIAFAAAGSPSRARQMLSQYRLQVSVMTDPDAIRLAHEAASLIAYAERRYGDGVGEARAADVGGCTACALPLLALNYEKGGQSDSAIAVYIRYVESSFATPSPTVGLLSARSEVDGIFLPGAYKSLGTLYEARGNSSKAAEYYQKFVELWKNADAELQPQVSEVRQRLLKLRSRP